MGDAFGSPTPYGFEVPLGNPGSLEGAARACSEWGAALIARATRVRAGANAACSNWTGSAESGFAAHATHVVEVYDTLGGVVNQAGAALSSFARELETAQRATTQTRDDCENLSRQVVLHQQEGAEHGQTAQMLSQQMASAVDPAARAE